MVLSRRRLIPGFVMLVVGLGVVGCSKRGPRDVENRNPRSEFADGPRGLRPPDAGSTAEERGDRVLAHPSVGGTVPHELARVSARAIITSPSHVYFGDDEDDTLCALAKPGGGAWGQPERLARRAPAPGGLAIDNDNASIAWIADPGDVVLRIGWRGGASTTVRENGLFTDLAITNGEVFLTEARSGKGVLSKVTGTTATVLASTEGAPRGIAVDAEHVFVASTTRLARTLRRHERGDVTELATGAGFASPLVDDVFLYATAVDPKSRARRIVRVKKTDGGALETVATNVRDAPAALFKGILYWFDADQPSLLSTNVGAPSVPSGPGGAVPTPVVVSEDPRFDRPRAITVDDDGAFVATGYGEAGRVLLVPFRTAPARAAR